MRQENREVGALVLLCLGLILGIAIYTNATGGVGNFLDNLTGRFFGLGRLLIPPALLVGGWVLLRMRGSRRKRRVFYPSEIAAWASAGIGFFSLIDIIGGRPFWGSPVEDLSGAGGWVGVFFGGTMHRYLGEAGQFILTFTLFAIAATLLTSVSVSEFADSIAERLQPVREWFDEFFDRVGFADDEVEDVEPVRRRRYKKVFEEDEYEDDEDYIDLRSPGAMAEVSDWADEVEPVIEVPQPSVAAPMSVAALQPVDGQWRLPNISSLDRTELQEVDTASVEATGRQLEHALAEHGVETRLVGVVVGPTVSRFELELGPGVKVARVTSLSKDIAYAMATPDVRILAPIPGKQAIGVEVPNVRRQIVTVGDLLVSEEASTATHPLEVALGRDINGRTVMANLAEMPHLLVAGQTGSGKSSCINTMLTSILMRSTPEQVRLILIDPKRVELTQYRGLPHLLTDVVTDPKKAANALSWAVKEMERRYDILHEHGYRDLTSYNKAVSEDRVDSSYGADGEISEAAEMGYVLVVLDELADLMMVAARDVEESICRIAQKARAVGIHLVIATQRPSTNVITGLIKANIPARLAFAVSSLTDSRVILDQAGAERLVGRGDALLSDGRTASATRYQGAWVTEEEVSSVVEFWAKQAPELVYDSRVVGETITKGAAGSIPGGTTGNAGDDELLVQAIELVVSSQLGSTSMLQRKLRVGFARAGRLMDLLEERGIVGPSIGSKAREVLITQQELADGKLGGGEPESSPIAVTTVNPRAPKATTAQPIMPEHRQRRTTLADIANPEPAGSPTKVVDAKPGIEIIEEVDDEDEIEIVDLDDRKKRVERREELEVLEEDEDDLELTDEEEEWDEEDDEEYEDDDDEVVDELDEDEEWDEDDDEVVDELDEDEEWDEEDDEEYEDDDDEVVDEYDDEELEDEEDLDEEEEDESEEYDEELVYEPIEGADPALAPPPGYSS